MLQCCLLQVTSLAGWVVATGGYRGELPRTTYLTSTINMTKIHAVCNLFKIMCFEGVFLLSRSDETALQLNRIKSKETMVQRSYRELA